MKRNRTVLIPDRAIPGLAALAVLAAATTSAGCCRKQVCPPVPTPTQLMKPTAGRPGGPGQVVVVRHKQGAATPKEVAGYVQLARALYTVQELMGWHSRTRGERSVTAFTYTGRKRLISRRVIARIDAYLKTLTDPSQMEERKAVEYLRDYLSVKYVERETACYDDKRKGLEASAKVRLPWLKRKVPFRNLAVLMRKEKSAKRRAQIEAAKALVIRNVLNPVLLAKYTKAHDLAHHMGHRSYFHLSQIVRKVDVRTLLRKGHAFMQATDQLHTDLLKRVAKESLGKTLSQFRRSDHPALMNAPKARKFLPKELMLEAFMFFLKGIGLDLKTITGTTIRIDDTMHPKKHPRAACFPIEVPKDIRVTVKPTAGLMSWTTLFHEGGHALHYAWTTERRFAFQLLGNYTVTEAYAELFARIWSDPVWLKRFRGFVTNHNRRRPRPASLLERLRRRPAFAIARAMGMVMPRKALVPKKVPVMTNKDMAYLIRHMLAWNMYLYRRYGWAKLIYESALHGAPKSVWQTVYKGQISDRRKLYRELFAKAYGYKLGASDAAQYLFDVDPFFYSADYTRAFVTADTLAEHLRKKFGPDWYGNKQVGPYLKGLWAKGNRWTGAELLAHLGLGTLDYKVSEARVTRLLAEAKMLSGGKGKGKTARKKPCPRGSRPTKKGMCKIPKRKSRKGK